MRVVRTLDPSKVAPSAEKFCVHPCLRDGDVISIRSNSLYPHRADVGGIEYSPSGAGPVGDAAASLRFGSYEDVERDIKS